MINISSQTKIYIIAPGNLVSGGPEALHQLYFYMDNLGYDVYMCYYDGGKIADRYKIYNVTKFIELAQIEDNESHVIIVPEKLTYLLKNFDKIRKCIWWLGIKLYDGRETMPRNFVARLKSLLIDIDYKIYLIFKFSLYQYFKESKYIIQCNDYNLCGSKYAYDWVNRRYKNVKLFVEPISVEFLKKGLATNLNSQSRKDTVLYNPSKYSSVQATLISRSKFEYIPIKNLNISEMIELFREAKLYVDFGEFGGPERLPKETVYNGTLLLVANHNAAKNDFDIAIPHQYKIDTSNVVDVEIKIKEMLDNYNKIIEDFGFFRDKINSLEINFVNTIKVIFNMKNL